MLPQRTQEVLWEEDVDSVSFSYRTRHHSWTVIMQGRVSALNITLSCHDFFFPNPSHLV